MIRKIFCLALLPLLLATPSQSSNAWFDSQWTGSGAPDVHYVPTPTEVVAEMLRLADVGESDMVYDLGSGDGRIVITAAKERGAKGVGIDIDPVRVREGKQNAAEAGVSDRVTFLQQDLFTADFSDATVVTLYLLPDLNLRLRPKLFEQVKPGTRVVSHAFHMGDWTPDEETSIGRYNVFFWIVPANVSGEWEWRLPGDNAQSYRLQLVQDFQKVKGVLRHDSGLRPADRIDLKGDRLELTFEKGEGPRAEALLFEGRVDGDVIEGTVHRVGEERTPWRAERVPGTKMAIDEG